MSLWTPYEPEEVLDLSKTASAVQNSQQTVFHSPPYADPVPEAYYSGHRPAPPSPGARSEQSLFACSPPASSPDSSSGRTHSGPKLARPFKAVTAALPASSDPDPNYAAFRAAMLEAMRLRNGGSLTVSNPRMRRSVHRSNDASDDYIQRRARNNAAAKRSRDLRKQKEDELAIRVAYLEQENSLLQQQLALTVGQQRCPRCVRILRVK